MSFEKINNPTSEIKEKPLSINSHEGVIPKLSPETTKELAEIQDKLDKLQDKIEQIPEKSFEQKEILISELSSIEDSFNSIKEKIEQENGCLSVDSIPELKESSTQLKEIKNSLKTDENTIRQDIQYTEINRRLPTNVGIWEGERGNSKWIPEGNFVPTNKDGSNPENLSMEKILSKHSIHGIKFNDGEPDFSPVSHSTIEIPNFSSQRYGKGGNFHQADTIFAKEKGISLQEVYEYKGKHNVTWHERSDCKTMDLVPREIHNNIRHDGGISAYKKVYNK